MLVIDQFKVPLYTKKDDLKQILAKKLRVNEDEISDFKIVKKSIDARKKPDVYLVYSLAFSHPKENVVLKKSGIKQLRVYNPKNYKLPQVSRSFESVGRPIVVGMGPAGLFCAYYLALTGFKPLVLERGKDVDSRKADIDEFWNNGKLLLNSNVQFGEGGAGTFSDGKLNTLVGDKDGKLREVLKLFVKFGAKEDILFDSKPHVGTDVLINVVRAMREEIISLGGEVRFEAQVTEICLDNSGNVNGVIVNDYEKISCNTVVLALGHSARDTFYMLKEKGIFLEQKPFAMGFRVQHPQDLIDKSQYGFTKEEASSYPGAAPYKLACKTDNNRNVYSFCMCPGGYVVNASSEYERLAINGMSYSKRDGVNANSAILMNVNCEDFGSDNSLAGVELQRNIEAKAYSLGKGRIPCCRFGDFCGQSSATDFENNSFKPEFKGGFSYADLTTLFNADFTHAFVDGMKQFGKIINGFDSPDTIVAGVESRSSSPVRITRNEDCISINTPGLYPCGEGAGYAGGIMSAAMDGIRVFEAIVGKDEN